MPKKLPPYFKPLFWETDYRKIDPQKYRHYVVARILQWGRPKHVRWMLNQFSKRFILQVNRRSREIYQKRKNFWNLYLRANAR